MAFVVAWKSNNKEITYRDERGNALGSGPNNWLSLSAGT